MQAKWIFAAVLAAPLMKTAAFADVSPAERAAQMLARAGAADTKCNYLQGAERDQMSSLVARAELSLANQVSVAKTKATMAKGRALGEAAPCSAVEKDNVRSILGDARKSAAANDVKSRPAKVQPQPADDKAQAQEDAQAQDDTQARADARAQAQADANQSRRRHLRVRDPESAQAQADTNDSYNPRHHRLRVLEPGDEGTGDQSGVPAYARDPAAENALADNAAADSANADNSAADNGVAYDPGADPYAQNNANRPVINRTDAQASDIPPPLRRSRQPIIRGTWSDQADDSQIAPLPNSNDQRLNRFAMMSESYFIALRCGNGGDLNDLYQNIRSQRDTLIQDHQPGQLSNILRRAKARASSQACS